MKTDSKIENEKQILIGKAVAAIRAMDCTATVKRSKKVITITMTTPDGAKCVAQSPNLASLKEVVGMFEKAAKNKAEKSCKQQQT